MNIPDLITNPQSVRMTFLLYSFILVNHWKFISAAWDAWTNDDEGIMNKGKIKSDHNTKKIRSWGDMD